MARKVIRWEEGTPQRAIDDAIDVVIGKNRNDFFRKLVTVVPGKGVTTASAKKAYHRLMNREGMAAPLIDAYVAVLGIDRGLLEELVEPVDLVVMADEPTRIAEISRKLDLLLDHFGLLEPGVELREPSELDHLDVPSQGDDSLRDQDEQLRDADGA